MLLKIPDVDSASFNSVTVKRCPLTRDEWVSYYDGGHRLCRVAFKDGCCWALMVKRPETNKGSITFAFSLFLVAEVWGGMDNQLCSVFVQLDGCIYQGMGINGWKFKLYDGQVKFPMVKPSEKAEEIALKFLSDNCDQLITTKSDELLKR